VILWNVNWTSVIQKGGKEGKNSQVILKQLVFMHVH